MTASRQSTEGPGLAATAVASSLAGGIGRVLFYPLDVCKARLQASMIAVNQKRSQGIQVPRHVEKIGLTKVLRGVWQTEGLGGCYRGIGIAVFGSIPATCLYFVAYEHFKSLEVPPALDVPFLKDFVAGFAAEAVSCLIWVPVDVSKEQLQTQTVLKVANFKGSADALRQILIRDGIGQLYRGYGATLLSFGPFSAIYFMLYEQFKSMAWRQIGDVEHKHCLPIPWLVGASGAAAGITAWVTSPLDMVKMRLQVQRAAARSVSGHATPYLYKGFYDGAKNIWKHEGPRAFFRGSFARLMFSTPSVATTVTLMELIRAWYTSRLWTP